MIHKTEELPWFALKVRFHHEKIAALSLESKGYRVFLPLFRSRRRWSDRFKEVDIPLFATYLFCRFDGVNQLPILSTPGLVGVVGFGNKPVPVDDAEMARVEAIVKSPLQAEPWPWLRPGQTVRVERGPLRGLEGTLIEFRKTQRLVVGVTLLQRFVAVEIERDWVEPGSFGGDSHLGADFTGSWHRASSQHASYGCGGGLR